MIRLPILLLALAVATPSMAQDGAPPPAAQAAPPSVENTPPPPEFIAAAQALGECLKLAVQPGGAAAGEAVPEAAARLALATCSGAKVALATRFDAWIASPAFPEAARASARQQFREQMDGLEARLAREMRAALAARAGAPVAAPTPTPPSSRP